MTGTPAHCRICASPRTYPLPFGYDFAGRRLRAITCRDCGIIFLDPQPSPAEIAGMYAKEYFEGDYRCGHEGSCFDDAARASLTDLPLLARLRALVPSGRFLEIGCAGGAFLNAARASGYDVTGVEFSAEAAQFARETFGLPVITGDVADARLSGGSFALAYMGDVIEHLPDPVASLREIRRLLVPGGTLVMACPSQTNTLFSRTGFVLYRALGQEATVRLPPYHLFEYRPASMRSLLERCGFDRVKIAQGLIPPGTIALRGTAAERIGKKSFHYINTAVTALSGAFGDRLEVTAVRGHD
jgi:SAM-dependent methyltransferase